VPRNTRNYVLFILIIAVTGGVAWYYIYLTENYINDTDAKLLSEGVFNLITPQLLSRPTAHWQHYIQSLQPKNGTKLILITLDQVPKNIHEYQSLLSGSIVANDSEENIFSTRTVFKRIEKTPYVLQLSQGMSRNDLIQNQTAWMRILLNKTLRETPKDKWPQALKHISSAFGNWPVKLIKLSSYSKQQQDKLKKGNILLFDFSGGGGGISYEGSSSGLLFLTPDKRYVLALGPLSDVFLSLYNFYFICIASLIALLAICWIWTFPFYRNLNKLQKLAEAYGEGQFTYDITVPKKLALHPLYTSLKRCETRRDEVEVE
jgi:hypothetical protein